MKKLLFVLMLLAAAFNLPAQSNIIYSKEYSRKDTEGIQYYTLHFDLKDLTLEELQDANLRKYTNAVTRGCSKMIVLTFYFE